DREGSSACPQNAPHFNHTARNVDKVLQRNFGEYSPVYVDGVDLNVDALINASLFNEQRG
uniref:hypothetical protein n=1 Tax=Paenibacillus riograndensis TaxID=483937 RepID=UPI001B7F93D1